MQTIMTSGSTWFLITDDSEPGLPPRVAITPPFRIGRREGFDLCLSCRNVSGLHAELVEEHGELFVEDLNSTNGTFLNGKKIQSKTMLKNGDSLQVGQSYFTVSCPQKNKAPMRTFLLGDEEETPQETTEDRFARLLVDGVVPFFQPVFNIAGEKKRQIGYEVLGRSRLFGLRTPDQMFGVATDLEKESELSRTLRTRGIEAAESHFPSGIKLFVNTHPSELDHNEIKHSLEQIRARYPTREIMLELPELVLYSADEYQNVFQVARDQRVRLVLHDFGAGQIRLTELSKMNPAVVKFDCALIQGIDGANHGRQKLVSAMVKMITELGITPMAEYVETKGEHETLKQLGFELAQGYFYGRPTSIEELEDVDVDSEETAAKANRTPERPLASLNNLMDSSTEKPGSQEVSRSALPSSLPASPPVDESANDSQLDAQWLLEQDPESLTLQLMFTAKQENATEFVAQQTVSGDYTIYRKWSSNRDWYVVVFGVYEDRAIAKSDVELFEDSKHSTWVRKMADIHEEVRSVDNANATGE